MIMKKIWIFVLPLLLAACSSKLDMVELTDWQFEYNGKWYPATVPGFIHTDLMANGLIPDPYYGTNEDSVQWLANREWKYRTVLSKEELSRMVRNEIPPNDTIWLTFEGLAGRAEILVQCYLGSSAAAIGDFVDNMFVEHTLPIEIWGKFDSIVIQLFFQYPYDSDSLREANYGITLPERRAFTRIAPYQQGWDWGPKLQTCGIWKPVYITNRKPDNPDNPGIPEKPENPVHCNSGRSRTPSARASPSTVTASPSSSRAPTGYPSTASPCWTAPTAPATATCSAPPRRRAST